MSIPRINKPGPILADDWEYYLQFESPVKLLQTVANDLKFENRYFVDERFQKLLFALFFNSQSRYFSQDQLLPNQRFYRARIYNQADAMTRIEHPEAYGAFQGFDRDGCGAPPPEYAKSERASPEGISYLYVANNENTAIKEVRAQPGDYVSVATVLLKESVIVANLTNGFACLEAETPEKTKWINDFSLALEGYYQSPAGRIGGYYLCQYISEYAKIWGLQGIQYRSSFSVETLGKKEVNLTLFSNKYCEITASKLYYISQMHIETLPSL